MMAVIGSRFRSFEESSWEVAILGPGLRHSGLRWDKVSRLLLNKVPRAKDQTPSKQLEPQPSYKNIRFGGNLDSQSLVRSYIPQAADSVIYFYKSRRRPKKRGNIAIVAADRSSVDRNSRSLSSQKAPNPQEMVWEF